MAKRSKHHECPEGQFGPVYDITGNGLAKHRKLARNGLGQMSRAERQAYGEAVEAAVLASQRRALAREVTLPRSGSASGTFHNDGAAIHKAVLNQQRQPPLATHCHSR